MYADLAYAQPISKSPVAPGDVPFPDGGERLRRICTLGECKKSQIIYFFAESDIQSDIRALKLNVPKMLTAVCPSWPSTSPPLPPPTSMAMRHPHWEIGMVFGV